MERKNSACKQRITSYSENQCSALLIEYYGNTGTQLDYMELMKAI
jgi:hypothetical protein